MSAVGGDRAAKRPLSHSAAGSAAEELVEHSGVQWKALPNEVVAANGSERSSRGAGALETVAVVAGENHCIDRVAGASNAEHRPESPLCCSWKRESSRSPGGNEMVDADADDDADVLDAPASVWKGHSAEAHCSIIQYVRLAYIRAVELS